MLRETDLKQNEIAEATGVSNTMVYKIVKESGMKRNTKITLIKELKGKGVSKWKRRFLL